MILRSFLSKVVVGTCCLWVVRSWSFGLADKFFHLPLLVHQVVRWQKQGEVCKLHLWGFAFGWVAAVDIADQGGQACWPFACALWGQGGAKKAGEWDLSEMGGQQAWMRGKTTLWAARWRCCVSEHKYTIHRPQSAPAGHLQSTHAASCKTRGDKGHPQQIKSGMKLALSTLQRILGFLNSDSLLG